MKKKILIYGVGPFGSLFAERLAEAGHSVFLLDHGERQYELKDYGVVTENTETKKLTITHLPVVDSLGEEDFYDLVIVPMRKNRVAEILPTLSANKNVPTFLFMMNNAAGQQEFIEALGKDRVMAGLPQPGGFKKGHVMHMMPVEANKPVMMPIGEVDGRVTARTLEVAKILGSMRGYRIDIRNDIDDWLKTHVALIIPAMASAVYACNSDQEHFAATRDAHVLLKRALHEALQATEDAGVTLTPPGIKLIDRIPEPVFVSAIGNIAKTPIFENILGHLKNAGDEIEYLTDEFYAMIRKGNTPTPTVDQLTAYTYGSKQFLPFGSKEIPLRWGAVYGLAFGAAAVAGIAVLAKKQQKSGRGDCC